MLRTILALVFLTSCLQAGAALAVGFARVGTYAFNWATMEADSRSESLAGTDMATARGPAAHWFNAAPLPAGESIQVAYSHKAWPGDLGLRFCSMAGQKNGLRLGFTWAELYLDSDVQRTSYNPDGTARTYDVKNRIMLLGLSYDLSRWIAPDNDGLQWIIGGNLRYYDGSLVETDMNTEAVDLGTTLAWRRESTDSWMGASGAVTAHSLLGGKFEFGESATRLFQHLRGGLAIYAGIASPENPRIRAELALSYLRIENTGASSRDYMNTNSRGLELTLCDVFSVRQGYRYDDNSSIDNERWGLGLRTPDWIFSRFGLSLDYNSLGTFAGDKDHWSFSGWWNL